MAESVYKTRGYVNENEHEDSRQPLTEEEWSELQEIILSLKPARGTTTILQSSQLLLRDFFAAWMKCKYRSAAVKSDLALELVKNMNQREKARVNKKGEKNVAFSILLPGVQGGNSTGP